jgi:CubicO group peptidase (beta-lactamase class C family)
VKTKKLKVTAAVLALIALALVRPGARYQPLRQMAIFSESSRIHNSMAMEELFPAHRIQRSTTPHHFQIAPRALPASYSFKGETRKLDAFIERTVTTGFLVLQNDAIVDERYFHGASVDSRMTSWSVAKSVVSLLIGIAHDEGRIPNLDASLDTLAPGLRGSDYGKVPLRDALNMSSGIEFNEDYGDALSDIHTLFARVFLLGGHGESVAHYLGSLRREVAPGSRFHYVSTDTFALGLALRGAVGTSLSRYAQQKLWQPLGMERDALWNMEDGGGVELGFCCLNVSLRDYAKIGRLVARRGDWDGRRIVSEDWLRESARRDPKRAPGTIPGMSLGYQHQWWQPAKNPATVMAAGVWGQYIYVNPTKALVIVKTSVDPEFDANMDENVALFEAIDSSL